MVFQTHMALLPYPMVIESKCYPAYRINKGAAVTYSHGPMLSLVINPTIHSTTPYRFRLPAQLTCSASTQLNAIPVQKAIADSHSIAT